MYELCDTGFIDESGAPRRSIILGENTAANDWTAKQQNSMSEYLHALVTVAPENTTLYRLFDQYVATQLQGRQGLRILDIGCGLRNELPEYVRSVVGDQSQTQTNHIYVGLDPIAHHVSERDYLFVCGRIEDFPAYTHERFDAFLFATSLDHFEDIERVAVAIRQLATPRACCLVWVGLHDRAAVAEQIGARSSPRIFSGIFLVSWARSVAAIFIDYLRLLRRQRRLRRARALDSLHFHYFTEASITSVLSNFGKISDTLRIPGTNSLFATVRIETKENVTP
jgi:SAM-dependent methyltransferase